MYSYEIKKLLEIKNNLLRYEEYLKICNSSPQIDHIKYNIETDDIDMWTKDNFHFKIKVKKYE